MLVSVIMPTYGDTKYLQNAINSVLAQSERDLELIVVDDNNPDSEWRKKAEEMVSQTAIRDNRVKYLKHPHNINGAAARNTGLKEAKGDYIAFIDADDEYVKNRVERCVKVLQGTPEKIGGVYTGCEFRRFGKKYNEFIAVQDGNHLIETLKCTFMFCSGSNIFMKREAVMAIEGFDEHFQRHQDYEFLVRFFQKYDMISIPEILLIKNNEMPFTPNVEKLIEIKEQYLGKYKYIIDQLDKEDATDIYYTQYILVGETALKHRQYQTARKYYSMAAKYKRLDMKRRVRKIGFVLKGLMK